MKNSKWIALAAMALMLSACGEEETKPVSQPQEDLVENENEEEKEEEEAAAWKTPDEKGCTTCTGPV